MSSQLESLCGAQQAAPPPVKSFSAGVLGSDGYGEMLGFKSTSDSDKASEAGFDIVPPSRRKRVVIVGAGVSGVQQASILLRDGYVKHQDIQIFDALDGFGGVWQKNTYPGCACDVPAMIYTTSYRVCKSMFLHHFFTLTFTDYLI
jgi:hypothetical protein